MRVRLGKWVLGLGMCLAAAGCAKAQGWHYGKPLSVMGVRRLLAERRLIQPGSGAINPEAPDSGQRLAG